MQPPAEKADEEGEQQLSALELLNRLVASSEPSSLARRGGVKPLTDEERELAESGLDSGGNPSEVLASRFNVEVTRKQLQCLRPAEWLNDEVINFYCKLLEERGKKNKNAPKCWFPNSFFWPKLSGADNSSYSYKDVKRWSIKAKIDIFELDHILFPMNIGESHWALGAIDLKAKGFRYFDSMFCRPHRNFVPFLRKYLQDEHKAKKGGSEFQGVDEWELIIPDEPVPQQNNGYDCGVFTCNFAECFSSGRDLGFSQDDMPDLRLRLAARVMRGNEDWED
jgi:sentrin-specific protease 1